jgi:hypothetical protein
LLGVGIKSRRIQVTKKEPPQRIGTQGWKQFLTARKEILDAYDKSRTLSKVHETETYHGKVAEAEFRKWLSSFLPKKYAVTAGYIISQGAKDTVKAPHFDVIIYNQHDSPILWVEDNSDTSLSGRSLAIPAEYVYSVMEVKASFESSTTKEALTHLQDLEPLLAMIDYGQERCKKYLPSEFFSVIVFIELRKKNEYSAKALDNMLPRRDMRGYRGGIILRAEDDITDKVAEILIETGDGASESSVGKAKAKESLITGSPLSKSFEIKPNEHLAAFLMWNEANFAKFAFDIVASLNGTYRRNYISSRHGMNWLNPERHK